MVKTPPIFALASICAAFAALALGSTSAEAQNLSRPAREALEAILVPGDEETPGPIFVVRREGLPAGEDVVLFIPPQPAHSPIARSWPAEVRRRERRPRVEIRQKEIQGIRADFELETLAVGELLVLERIRFRRRRVELDLRTLQRLPIREDVPAGLDLYLRSRLVFHLTPDRLQGDETEAVLSMIRPWVVPFDMPEQAWEFRRRLVPPKLAMGMTSEQVKEWLGEPEECYEEGDLTLCAYEELIVYYSEGRALSVSAKETPEGPPETID